MHFSSRIGQENQQTPFHFFPWQFKGGTQLTLRRVTLPHSPWSAVLKDILNTNPTTLYRPSILLNKFRKKSVLYSTDSHPSPSHIHTSSHKRVAAFTHCAHICNTHMLNSVHYFSCCSPENRMEKVWLLRCWFCCWKIKREKKRASSL